MKNGKLFLFEWREEPARERAQRLSRDWSVELEFEEGSRGCRNCKAFGPDVIVLDLAVKPSHSREVGRALRRFKPLRGLPFIFVDGTAEDVALAKEKVPDGLFVTSGKLAALLAKLPSGKTAS